MGGTYISRLLPGELTSAQLQAKFREMQDTARAEHGDSYSGDWNMACGLHIVSTPTFATQDAADKYVQQNAQKWEVAWAVRCRIQKRVVLKQPTYNGKRSDHLGDALGGIGGSSSFGFGGVCAGPFAAIVGFRCVAVDYGYGSPGTYAIVAADQLDPETRQRVITFGKRLWDAKAKRTATLRAMQANTDALFPPAGREAAWLRVEPDWDAMRRLHHELILAVQEEAHAHKALAELDAKLSPGLFVTEDKQDGERWYIGAMVAC